MTLNIKKHRAVIIIFSACFALIVSAWIWAYKALRAINQPLIIHFNSFEGINQVGSFWDLTGISIIVLIFTTINLFISIELENRSLYFGRLYAAASLFICALLFIGFSVIIGIN